MITLQERVELESEYARLNHALWIACDTDTVAAIRARMVELDNILRPARQTESEIDRQGATCTTW